MRRLVKHDAKSEDTDIIDDVNPVLHLHVDKNASSLSSLVLDSFKDENAFLERKLENNMDFMVPAVISKRLRLVNLMPDLAFVEGDEFVLPIMLKVSFVHLSDTFD